MPVDNIFPSSS